MNIFDQFDSHSVPAEESPFDQFDHIHASELLKKPANHEGSEHPARVEPPVLTKLKKEFSDPLLQSPKIQEQYQLTERDLADPKARQAAESKLKEQVGERAMDWVNTGGSLAGVIKKEGGNWLADTVDKALKSLIRHTNNAVPEVNSKNETINKWIQGPLRKYIMNRMATPSDEIRGLAEQGVLHVDPETLNFRTEEHGKNQLHGQTSVARSNAAKTWEGAADLKVFNNEAGDLRSRTSHGRDHPPRGEPTHKGDMPWLLKLDPKDTVHSIAEPHALPMDLGLDHLVDIISEKVHNGEIRPDPRTGALPLSVADAVRITHGYNAEKTKAMEKARASDMAGLPVHKDYGDYKWVELSPESKVSLPPLKDYKIDKEEMFGKTYYFPYDPKGNRIDRGFPTREKAEEYLNDLHTRDPKKMGIQRLLDQEGDAMGHCVGGYCDQVMSGDTKIYSLRDNKGNPHVTIEVDPRDRSIVQIKGKQNKKPDTKYLPMIQDFVKFGRWDTVNDLSNTGLTRLSGSKAKTYGLDPGYYTKEELEQALIKKPTKGVR